MKKKDVVTLILGILALALIAVGVFLIIRDSQISTEVANMAESTQAAIIADESKKDVLEAEFIAFRDSKPLPQLLLTIFGLVSVIGGIACAIFCGKGIDSKFKKKKED